MVTSHVRDQNPLGPDHLVVFLIVLVTMWARRNGRRGGSATSRNSASPGSNSPGVPVYPPPAFFWWWYAYDAYAPQVFVEGAYIAASGGFISIAVPIGMSVWRAREAKNAETYGSARWATPRGRSVAGLLGADGVVLGRSIHDYLRHDGPEHVLCFAPTRSGKGVGLVVPTLLTWPGSASSTTSRARTGQLTAGFRARARPRAAVRSDQREVAAYNPLLEVRRGEWEVRDVQNVADVLVDPEGSLESGTIGRRPATRCWSAPSCTSSMPRRTRRWPASPASCPIRSGRSRPRFGDDDDAASRRSRAHPVVASAARELLNKSENERSGVLSTAMSFLGLYRDPVVAEVTRRCDWRIADLIEGSERPATLYLVVPPSDISRTKPLVRLILNQIGRRLTEDLHAKDAAIGS
jgi:type IV secretion system protein VirD4